MKFYEFEEEFDYYALIAANDVEEAKGFYNECICEVETGNPKEIIQEEAYKKLLDSCENNRQKREEILNFKTNMQETEPFIILIDGCLL